MPIPTPKQKIEQVKMFGGKYIEVILTGDTFDDAFNDARKYGDVIRCSSFTLLMMRK